MVLSSMRRCFVFLTPWRVFLSFSALVAFLVFAGSAIGSSNVADIEPQTIKIRTRPFVLDSSKPKRKRFGELEWRGGLRLSASHSAFGGISGLSLSDDGRRALFVTDRGSWLSAKLSYKDGWLAGVTDARIGAIPQKDGKRIRKRSHRDAEALVPVSPREGLEGRYFIGFEGYHRLDVYEFADGVLKGPVRRGGLPKNLRRMSSNKGLEGIAAMSGGQYQGGLILFAERKLNGDGDHVGSLVFDSKAHPLTMRRHEQFNVTALESLSDGSLLVLERSFIRSALRLDIRLRLIPADEIKPKARLKGRVLMQASRRLAIDNFEGMAVREKDGEALITIISDDNFNFFQSTLMAQFALKLPEKPEDEPEEEVEDQ